MSSFFPPPAPLWPTLPCPLVPPITYSYVATYGYKQNPDWPSGLFRVLLPQLSTSSGPYLRALKCKMLQAAVVFGVLQGPHLQLQGTRQRLATSESRRGCTSLRVRQLAAWSTDPRCSQTDTRPSPASRILPQSRAFRLSRQIYKEQRESCRLILHPSSPAQPHSISLNEDRTDCRESLWYESILTEGRPSREATLRFSLP